MSSQIGWSCPEPIMSWNCHHHHQKCCSYYDCCHLLPSLSLLRLLYTFKVGGPPPSHGAEEDVTHEGEEAPVSLTDAYRGIMAGVGLSGDALEAWLEEWMKLISADVGEMGQGGIGSTIPGSRAAELLVERRLGTAVAAIAGKCMLLHMI